ncbi:hypothetical protein [Hamadaea tsunoensis]|uniref:hypothetical protein n=1 Tax=Hamadaea tsunoensis TaxID=53368 RepID=UPI00041EC589|nr:hypothetical protein [Hamadaea tsunoensis]
MRQDNDVQAGRTRILTQKFASLRSTLTTNLREHLNLENAVALRQRAKPQHAVILGLVSLAAVGALSHSTPANAEATNSTKATTVAEAARAQVSAADRSQRAATVKTPATAKAATPAKTAKATPTTIAPVAGLDQTQMKNAIAIVKAGQELGIPERGQIVAVATAMQESKLYNLASYVVPESLKYAHEGTGADYDSVGLFQQRYTTGWGTVKSIMNPSESAKKFYRALQGVGGWQNMPITVAAQTVQGSAFPDAYAQHTGNATAVVKAINAAQK